MTRKYHYHTLQTNPRYREEELQIIYSNTTSIRQQKQSSQLSLLLFKMITKLEGTQIHAQQNKEMFPWRWARMIVCGFKNTLLLVETLLVWGDRSRPTNLETHKFSLETWPQCNIIQQNLLNSEYLHIFFLVLVHPGWLDCYLHRNCLIVCHYGCFRKGL